MTNPNNKIKIIALTGLGMLILAGFALLPRKSQDLNAEDCRPYSQNGSSVIYRCANGAMFTQTSAGSTAPSGGNYTLIPTNVNYPSSPYNYNSGSSTAAPNPWQTGYNSNNYQNQTPYYPQTSQPSTAASNQDYLAAGQGTAPFPDVGGPLTGVDTSGRSTVGVGPACVVSATHKCLY